MSRNKDTQKKRHRARCRQAFLLHFEQGMTVRKISDLFGDKTPEQVSEMVKIGERFSDSGAEK